MKDADLASGRIFPGQDRLREVALAVAVAVATTAWRDGLATQPRPDDPELAILASMYRPGYPACTG